MSVLRRCRPLLGTLVEMRVEGLPAPEARVALQTAFEEVAEVHRRMSFHSPDSDVSRLHRVAPGTRVDVDARMFAVLRQARRLAQLSDGAFDVTIGAQLVRSGALPRPDSAFEPDDEARWSAIELLPGNGVSLRRPLWLDLGGIAKGYAVDRAVAMLRRHGATRACVNAGGDLRVFGDRAEAVFLRTSTAALGVSPDLELANAALATSTPCKRTPAHFDRARVAIDGDVTVSVVAPRCVHADALTKVVLGAAPEIAARALVACAAQAYLHSPARGWRTLERAA